MQLGYQRGATLVEAAIGISLFLTLSLFIIDGARYLYISMALSRAAFTGADLASKLDMAIYTDQSSCPRATAAEQPCIRFRADIQRIADTVRRIALVVASPNPRAPNSLVSFATYRTSNYTNPAKADALTQLIDVVAVLRPGELALKLDGSGYVMHPTRPGKMQNGNPSQSWPDFSKSESWESVLALHPIVIYIEALMQPVTPFLSPVRIQVTQAAFRRTSPITFDS